MNENNPATIKDKWNSDQDSITRYRYRYNSGDAMFPSKEGLSVFVNRLRFYQKLFAHMDQTTEAKKIFCVVVNSQMILYQFLFD